MRGIKLLFLIFLCAPLLLAEEESLPPSFETVPNGAQPVDIQNQAKKYPSSAAVAPPRQTEEMPNEARPLPAPKESTKVFELSVPELTSMPKCPETPCGGYTVNFEDIAVTQLIRFISQISETNFIYNNDDLRDIKVTIVSDEPASTPDLMAALVQVLRMRGLSVSEQGKNVLIYKTDTLSKKAMIITDDNLLQACDQAVITRVFRLFNLSPEKISHIIKPFLSKDAVIEVLTETRHLIVSDSTSNIQQVAELLAVIDTPNLALDIAEYQVRNGSPDVLVNFAKDILSPLIQNNPFQMIPQPAAHKIFIVTTPYLIHKAIAILESLDTPEISEVTNISPPTELANNQIYVYRVRYHTGSDIANALHNVATSLQFTGTANPELVSAIYSIQYVEMNNTLIVVGTPSVIDKVVQLITDLDTSPKQIYIEVLIIDTTLTNSLDFGVEWVALGKEQGKLAFGSGLLGIGANQNPPNQTITGAPQPPFLGGARNAFGSPPPNPARGADDTTFGSGGDIPLDVGFGFGIVGNIIRHNGLNFLTLGSLINALESDIETVIVLNPKIMAQDMQEANFFVGENIPYQTTNTIIRDTGSVTQNYQYEDVGVQLRVRPQVGPENTVILQIDQSVSDVSSTTTPLTPTTTKTLTSTRVHVPDGCFLVMSGHVRDDKSVTRSGIPCLGTLPYIGPAFSNTVDARKKRNLIMFIQPHIISDVRKEGIPLSNEEGYKYNWDSHPSSIIECDTTRAPEMQECAPPPPIKEAPIRREAIEINVP